MPPNTVAERIPAHDSFTGQAHQSFWMHAKKSGALVGVDIGLGTRVSFGQFMERNRGSARPLLYLHGLGRDNAARSI
jgi:hypothetical protein